MKTFNQWIQLQESDLAPGQLGPSMVSEPSFERDPINPMDTFKRLLKIAKSKPALYDALMADYNKHKDPAQSIRFAQNTLGIKGNKADLLAQGGKSQHRPPALPSPKSPYKAALLRGRKAEEDGGRNPFGG